MHKPCSSSEEMFITDGEGGLGWCSKNKHTKQTNN